MKFGAIFDDISFVETLRRMTSIVTKQSKMVIVKLSRTRMHLFSVSDRNAQVWCESPVMRVFSKYIFNGIAEDCDEIYLELNGADFVSILRSVNNLSKESNIRLIRDKEPYLSFEVDQYTDGEMPRTVCHTIPVVVISRRFWDRFQLTRFDYDVSIYMPALRTVRTTIERLKLWDNTVIFRVKRNGSLSVKANGSSRVETTFRKRELNPKIIPTREVCCVRLDVKRLLLHLNGLQSNCHTICSIKHERCVHLLSFLDETAFQLILPQIEE